MAKSPDIEVVLQFMRDHPALQQREIAHHFNIKYGTLVKQLAKHRALTGQPTPRELKSHCAPASTKPIKKRKPRDKRGPGGKISLSALPADVRKLFREAMFRRLQWLVDKPLGKPKDEALILSILLSRYPDALKIDADGVTLTSDRLDADILAAYLPPDPTPNTDDPEEDDE